MLWAVQKAGCDRGRQQVRRAEVGCARGAPASEAGAAAAGGVGVRSRFACFGLDACPPEASVPAFLLPPAFALAPPGGASSPGCCACCIGGGVGALSPAAAAAAGGLGAGEGSQAGMGP